MDETEELPIGVPIPGVCVEICDPDGAGLPDGVSGEIVIAGGTVAKGYLNDPALTAELFSDGAGARRFRTRDLGYRRADGHLVFQGRADRQVKIRGHRIELPEIEHIARSCPGVAEASAILIPDAPPWLCLVAVTDAGTDRADTLSDYLVTRLPDFAQPRRVVSVAEFPRLPNGKIDTNALRDLTTASDRATIDTAPPTGDVEIRIAQIWSDLLGVDAISRHSDFFDLGGDSLRSITLLSRARAEGFVIQPGDIFAAPTLEGFCAKLIANSASDIPFPDDIPINLMNTDAKETPVFLLHSNREIFSNVVRGLGDETPVGLQFSHHFFGSHIRLGVTVEELARDATTALRQLKPEGPYVLCGYSAGAIIVLEMARQLEAGGDPVALLCLLDPPYNAHSAAYETGAARLQRFGEDMLGTARGHLNRVMQTVAPDPEPQRRKLVNQAYAHALRTYDVTPYDGAAYAIVTRENPAFSDHSTLSRAFPGIEIDRLPYSHAELLSDHQGSLAISSRLVRRLKRL
jgi:aryl carrier-like protein/pimeloyl-ACP methyl ester carboxylesterase